LAAERVNDDTEQVRAKERKSDCNESPLHLPNRCLLVKGLLFVRKSIRAGLRAKHKDYMIDILKQCGSFHRLKNFVGAIEEALIFTGRRNVIRLRNKIQERRPYFE
jgi:hypothetical protein